MQASLSERPGGRNKLRAMTTTSGSDGFAANEQLRRIETVTDTELAQLSVEDLLAELLDRVQGLLSVDTVAVLLLDPQADQLVARAAKGIEAEVRQGVRIPLGHGFAGRVAAERHPVILPKVDHTTVLNPILWEHGISSLLGVPLLAGGAVLGVLHVGSISPRQFTQEDVQLLQIAADRVASAIQVQYSKAETAAAGLLQRSLLPARLPQIPGLEMAARYVPSEYGGLGGDWYDVFMLPSGAWCIAIGDVVGRGFIAAEAMGRLRTALRAHAMYSDDAAEALTRLTEQVRHFDGAQMLATVQMAIIEPSLNRVQLSSAGHPPPVLAVPGDITRTVAVPADPPIGVTFQARRAYEFDLPQDSVLCFYTDGLVERRGISLDVTLERLCDAIAPGPAEVVCRNIMGRLIGDEPSNDDTAVLVVRRVPVQVEAGAIVEPPAGVAVLAP
jgi:serine phosphatase RsbU (regulator of sigma subunit)